ncbi:MAG TPA: MFS transporter, partial [Streptosporangiaceae bacterium]|nr:MFS transporter [Streptosporangiaceae bacterium]
LGNAVEMAGRLALLVEVVPEGGYALGRTALNVTVGMMQVAGYAAGGSLVVTLGTRGAFLAAVAMNLTGAASCLGLRPRPARALTAAARPASLRGTRALLASPAIRATLLGHWLPNGLAAGAETLYVPYAGDRAGALFVSAALGMAAGDLAVGRFASPALRARIPGPMYVLLAAPYLAFPAHPPTWAAAALVAVASTGFGGTLGLNERLVRLLPEAMRGQGLGLAGAGTVSMQAIAAAVAGMLADLTRPGLAMALMALASVLTTAVLWRSLTRGPTG